MRKRKTAVIDSRYNPREREREGGRKGGRERASERQKSQKSWRISCEKSRQSRWNSWRSHRTHSEDSETHCKLDGRDDESRTLRFEEVKLSLSGDCFSGCIPAHVCKFSLPLPSLSLPSILHPRASMSLSFVCPTKDGCRTQELLMCFNSCLEKLGFVTFTFHFYFSFC